MIFRFTFLIILLSLMAGACKKKSKPEEQATTPLIVTPGENTSHPTLMINVPVDADGVFIASIIPHKFPYGNIGNLGNASAFIYSSPNEHTYIDGGVVVVNDTVIPRLSSGSYYFYGKPISGKVISGIDIDSASVWNIAGSNVTGVPSFSFSFVGMPTPVSAGPDKTSKSHPYELFFSPCSGADSIVVVLGGDSSTVKKTVVAGAQSVFITTDEVAGVRRQHPTTLASLSVTAYKMSSLAIAGKKYYFINSITTTITVYIGD